MNNAVFIGEPWIWAAFIGFVLVIVAVLTNEIMRGAFDLKEDEYKQVKSLA